MLKKPSKEQSTQFKYSKNTMETGQQFTVNAYYSSESHSAAHKTQNAKNGTNKDEHAAKDSKNLIKTD